MKLSSYAPLSLTFGLLTACAPGPEGNTTVDAKMAPASRAALVVPAGAQLEVIIETPMSSKTSQPGDLIEGRLGRDLLVNNTVVALAGSAVRGRVTAAVPSGRVKTRARLAFIFDTLVAKGGTRRAIETQAVDITADDTHTRDAVTVAGGAGAGAVIGAIVDGGKGAGLGALIGAGVGTGVVLIDKGNNINIASGGTLSIELIQPLRVRI